MLLILSPPDFAPDHAVASHAGFITRSSAVMLSTARLDVLAQGGSFVTLRALLDCGSQTSFVTANAIQRLGLSKRKGNLTVQCLGESSIVTNLGTSNITVRPVGKSNPAITMPVAILKKICSNLPTINIDVNKI